MMRQERRGGQSAIFPPAGLCEGGGTIQALQEPVKPEMPMTLPCGRLRGEERHCGRAKFPPVDCCLQSGFNFARGFSSPEEDGARRFQHLRRQLLAESAREQKREFFVLSLIMLACAWPILSMIVTVVQLYSRHLP
jgi:hypothetical protein